VRTRNQNGFSLIEIVIALGILASSVAVLMAAMSTAIGTQNRDEQKLKAVLLASNRMVELEDEIQSDMEKGIFPEEKELNGEFEDKNDEGYAWAYAIRKVEIPTIKPPGSGGGNDKGQNTTMVKSVIDTVVKDISQSVREIKLKVTWKDDETDEAREVILTTHIVNLKP
jgi:prepilin-type N-terminal cleavage/methylation domain-containing protein